MSDTDQVITAEDVQQQQPTTTTTTESTTEEEQQVVDSNTAQENEEEAPQEEEEIATETTTNPEEVDSSSPPMTTTTNEQEEEEESVSADKETPATASATTATPEEHATTEEETKPAVVVEEVVVVEEEVVVTQENEPVMEESITTATMTTTTTTTTETTVTSEQQTNIDENDDVVDANNLEQLDSSDDIDDGDVDANLLEAAMDSIQDMLSQAIMGQIEAFEGIMTYKWKQDELFLYVYLELIHGETLNATGAVTFTEKHIQAKTDDVSEQEPGRTLVDLDLLHVIDPQDSTFYIEDGEKLVLKLKKADKDHKWIYLFNAPIRMHTEKSGGDGDSDENNNNNDEEFSVSFPVSNPPLDSESTASWFIDLIQPDCIVGSAQFEAKCASFTDRIIGAFNDEEEHVDMTGIDQSVIESGDEQQLAAQCYERAKSSQLDDNGMKLLRKAASLNHVEAKRLILNIETKLLMEEEKSVTFAVMTARDQEEHDSIVKGFVEVKERLEQKKLDYAGSLVHTNRDLSALLDLAKIYQETKNYATAFIYLLEGATRGCVLCMQHLGTMYYYGSDNFPKDEQKASAWWRCALNRGYAAAAFNLCVLYGGDNLDDLPLAETYFELANFISGGAFLLPENIATKIAQQRQLEEQEEEDDDEMNPDDLLEAAAQRAFAQQQDRAAVAKTATTTMATIHEEDDEEHDDGVQDVEDIEEPGLEKRPAFGRQQQQQQVQKRAANPFTFNGGEFEEDEDEEPEEIVVKDVPGIGWKIAEWALTFGVLGAVGFAIKRNSQ